MRWRQIRFRSAGAHVPNFVFYSVPHLGDLLEQRGYRLPAGPAGAMKAAHYSVFLRRATPWVPGVSGAMVLFVDWLSAGS